ncbi:CDP-alcohol phosphatidyltransferase family protein [Mesorhizobium sp. M1E.F.Ca.ET.045.02.1.1]|uniref:CDP-alcohol phosphatidyltransferase family protein n=1 Tax=unclassified Mesorhizobium TaxID=325217 RepID=UPI000F754A5E|nr:MULTISPECIES: CDP-alcohol phosphatidyltransferase family protein [unclassified Mesorhizobium]RWD84277.1 MAG: CDP-alcohol phosphatidyltransferase family protein [Mesorhizobium sp.]AZO24333.1 CDP-alcohol phosphatidyltransferase family protein [Mesorhizobium sp. M1E.F.Ca.ET.045.02.1.1]RUW29019.1 CDP-alcohol phosphatidyltransferase family protein [Mesorhizobium sp. M1E.F.Ca.ET.041.01.1.1]RUW80401.1 CDP-alcohol phosphatidyltransferase family protein [Mesorhizobium sp. M1E.F.Ca.ET.063.01.1.1]TKB1
MPTLYALKPAFQDRLRPLVGRLAAMGVTANKITILAALLSVAAGTAIAALPAWRAPLFLIPVVLFARMALNAIDGMLAREHGQASTLGMYLNEICDVVSDLALILPFAAFPQFGAWGVVAFAIAAALTEFAGVLGIAAGIGRNYAGPFGKSDRALALGVVAVLAAAGFWPAAIAPFVFPAMATLSLLTAINRIRAGLIGSSG